jgi:hypothetical protein
MDYFAFDAIKDAKRYLTGEGRAGADNNNGRGTAVDAPSRTKDTEVGQKTEREGKGGMRKEEPRTADAVAMPAAIAEMLLLRLRKKTNGVGELLTTYGSIVTKTTTTRPSDNNGCDVWGKGRMIQPANVNVCILFAHGHW